MISNNESSSSKLNPFNIHSNDKFHDNVQKDIDDYWKIAKEKDNANEKETIEQRKSQYEKFISLYYNLVTDFYEYGWGGSFHFAPKHLIENRDASISRAEHYVALRLGLKPGMKVLDLGAGVGGPMREIARFSGASVTGINISKYQIARGSQKNKQYGLDDKCDFKEADFHKLPFEDNSVDAVYAIEATCHSPDRVKLFKEIHRILKPGGRFASYEWCVTDKYDAKNKEHRQIKEDIEIGNALPELILTTQATDSLKEAGFNLIEATDFGVQTKENPIPWYEGLAAQYTLSNWKYTWAGRWLTHCLVWTMETCCIAPRGSTKTSALLQIAASGLVAGGKTGVFTPSFFIVGEK